MGRRRVTLSQAKLVLPAEIEKKENEILCRQHFVSRIVTDVLENAELQCKLPKKWQILN